MQREKPHDTRPESRMGGNCNHVSIQLSSRTSGEDGLVLQSPLAIVNSIRGMTPIKATAPYVVFLLEQINRALGTCIQLLIFSFCVDKEQHPEIAVGMTTFLWGCRTLRVLSQVSKHLDRQKCVSGEWEYRIGTGIFFFLLFSAAFATYGNSQARGQIRTAAGSLIHSNSNSRSKLHLQITPQLMATPDL